MMKTVSFLFLALVLFAGHANAAFMVNIDEGSFEFRLDVKHMGSHVIYSKLDLLLQDFSGVNAAVVFDDLIISQIGQVFTFEETDETFSDAAALLTNGLPDWIVVSLTTPTRTSSIQRTEPDALFGDPSGSGGIDLDACIIESVRLTVTDLVFIHGFDPSQGAYTNIAVQGIVTVERDCSASLDADFSAFPTMGAVPLTVDFFDLSTGSVEAWQWNFGDGLTSQDQNPTHTYNSPGRYTITLTVIGTQDSDTVIKADFIVVRDVSRAMPWVPLLLMDD